MTNKEVNKFVINTKEMNQSQLVRKDTVWNFGFGPVLCLKHFCPMTIYEGCKECNKERESRIYE